MVKFFSMIHTVAQKQPTVVTKALHCVEEVVAFVRKMNSGLTVNQYVRESMEKH